MEFLLFGYLRLGLDVFRHVIDQTASMFLLALIQERNEVYKPLLVQFISSFLLLDFPLQSITGLDMS